MSANQNKTTPTETAQRVARSIWTSLALFCLFALTALPGLAQNLGVSQTGLPQPVGVGTNLTYTITVTNSDAAVAATLVTLTDTLPPQVAYVSDSGGCGVVGGVVTCSLGTIAANGSASVTIVVGTACGSIGQVTNTAVALEFEADTNLADNTNSIVNTVADLTPPTIVCSLNLTNECTGAGGATVTYSAPVVTDICGDANAPICNPVSGSTFAIGTTTVNCTVSDQAGNQNACSFLVVVRDTTPPSITTCAPDQTICAGGAGTALVPNFTGGVVASDTCGGVTITQSPLAGSTAAIGTTPITLTVTDSATPPNSSTCAANLIVQPNTTATALTSITNCPATSATFGPTVPSGTGPFTYSWTKNGAVIPSANSDTYNIPSVAGSDAGTYCVLVAGACTTATNCATLTVPSVVVTCSPNLTNECTGPSGANVTYTTTVTNACDPTASVSCVPASGSLFPSGVTTVTCTGNDVFLNTNTCSFTVTVRDTVAPTITTCAPNQTICPTSAGTVAVPDFTAGVVVSPDTCSPSLFVTQSPAAGLIVSSGTTTITIFARDSSNNTNTCTATLVVLTNTTATALVTITNCPGTPATFSTVASGTGPFSYSWTKNGATIGGQTASSFSIGSVASTDAGTYCAIVTGSCNSVTNCANLSVVAAPSITVQPTNAFAPMNNGTVFSVTATDINTAVYTLSYAWKSNGITVPGATASTFAVSNLSLSMNGDTYQVTVTDCAGSTASTIVTLGVNAIAGVSFDFNTPGQWTNAPYNIVGNDWAANTLANQQPFGPIVPYESATGGVGVVSTRGSGCLDLAFNTGNDETFMFTPLAYDFSQTGAVLNASIMVRLKIPTALQRTIQLGFMTSTNGNPTAPPVAASMTGLANVGWMSSIFQSTGIGVTNAYMFQTQHKVVSGTATIAQTPVNTISNVVNASAPQVLKTNNWYRFNAQFINMKQPIIAGTNNLNGSNYMTSATLQDMGLDGLTPGAIVLASPSILNTNGDIINSSRLIFAIRGFENGGNDYWDNIFVTTTNGPVFFVQQPTNQVVVQGDYATFRALVNGDGPYTYQWNSNGIAIPGAGNWKYITVPQTLANSGDSYTVTVTSTNNTITSSGATVTVGAKTFAVVSVGSVDGGVVGLRFSRGADPVTSQNPANYLINGVAATAAQLLVNNNIQQGRTNGTEVLLTPASSLSGAFTVTVNNVTCQEGVPIASPNNTASGTVAGLTGLDINPVAYGLLDEIATYPGSEYSFAPNSFTISGGGHDLFNAIDGFRYVYTQKSGDFDIKMRVPYLDALRTPNKCGFNIRATLEPWSEMVYAGANPALPGRQFYEGTVRQAPYSFAVSFGNNTAALFPNTWVRIRRSGNTILRYSSTNGVNWLFDGQTSPYPSLPSTVYFGIAVCANVGQRTLQQPVLAQVTDYGDFAGYPGAVIAITAQPTNPPAINAGSAATTAVIATLSGGGAPSGAGELGYLWQRTNNAAGGWTNMPSAGATNNIISTGNLLFTDNNTQMRVIISAPGALSVTSTVATISVIDTNPPTLTAVSSIGDLSLNRLIVNFSEFLSAGTALNPANYIVTNSLGVTQGIASVSFQNGNPLSVVLVTSNALSSGSFFVLVTTNVTDLNGNRIAANTVRQYIASAAPTPTLTSGPGLQGPVVIEWYTSLRSDGSPKDTVNAWKFKSYNPLPDGQADFETYSNVFGIQPGTFLNWADNYGAKIYSYYLAPTSGVYRFYTRDDDFGEFIMNTNNAPGTDSRLPMDRMIGVGGTTVGTVGPGNVQAGTNTPNFQSVWSICDNNPNTKYLNFFNGGAGAGVNSGYIVTPASGPSVVNGIRFTSAADSPERDPSAFTVEGTSGDPRSGTTLWTLLAAGSTGMTVTNMTNRLEIKPDVIFTNAATAAYTNTTPYSSYRVLFPSLRSYLYTGATTVPNSMQIAEVNLLGTNGVNNTPVKITPGGAVVQVTMTVNNANYVAANSATNTLVGGQLYYLEFRFKEGGGGDGATVAVRNDTTIPAATEVISNNFLVFPTNLAPATPVICELYAMETSHSPTVPILTTAPSFALPGVTAANGNLADLSVSTNYARFIARLPNTVGYCENMGFNTNLVSGNSSFENYLGKVYSYLVPPSNGLYRFWLRSDDSSQLWLNTNAVNSTDPNGITLLGGPTAFNGTYTSAGQNIALTGGQAYYMEIRWREGTGGDGCSVAMRAQADGTTPPTTEVIPGNYFQYPSNHLHTGPIGIERIIPTSPTVTVGDQITFQAVELSGSGTGLGGGVAATTAGGLVQTIGCVWLKNGTNLFQNMVYQTNEYWVTPPITLADDGAVITLLVSNSFSIATASATVHVAAAASPSIVSAVASQYFDSVLVTFDRTVDAYTSQQLANYSIGGLTVLSVERDDWRRNRVFLHTSRQAANTIYLLTVNGVKDGSGTATIAANSTINFSSWAFGGVGGVYVEIFTNVLNTLDDFFKMDPKALLDLPDISYYTNSVSDGIFATDTGNNFYATRITGLFIAPSNGLYQFFVRGDDGSQIYMNTNGADPAGKVLICRNDGANSASNLLFRVPTNGTFAVTNQLDGFQTGVGLGVPGASISPVISLTNGMPYFMEVLGKEGSGGDYVAVALHAISTVDGVTDLTGWPNGLNPVVGDILSAGNFSAPGNPDLTGIDKGPPAVTNILQNRLLTLSVTVKPVGITASYQWLKSTDNGGSFSPIVGATGSTYSQFVDLPDEGAIFKISVNMPGGSPFRTTLLHVIADTNPPVLISAGAYDAFHVGVVFNERVDLGDAYAGTGDPQYYIALDDLGNPYTFTGVIGRTNAFIGDFGQSAILVTDTAMPPGHYTLYAYFFADLAGNLTGYGYDGKGSADFTQVPLTPVDVGTILPNGGTAGAGSYNLAAIPINLGLNPFSPTNGGLDVVANGWDIWNGNDGFHFDIIRSISGNFDVKVRVQTLIGADQWSKAGLMVRDTTNSTSRWVNMVTTPTTTPVTTQASNNFSSIQWRTTEGINSAPGQSDTVGAPPVAYPNGWVRLQRLGTLFNGYQSSNGVDWVFVGGVNTATNGTMPDTLLLGLNTVSHDGVGLNGVANGDNLSRNAYAEYRDLNIPNPPTITVQPGPLATTQEVNTAISYSVTATNPADAGPLTYQWLKNGVAISSASNPTATNATLVLNTLKVTDSGIYSVDPANFGGGATSAPVSLTVTNVLPQIVNESMSITQGQSFTLSTAQLLANDSDPDGDILRVLSVSALPNSFGSSVATNFDQGGLANATLYGTFNNSGATYVGAANLASGGTANSGCLQLNVATTNAAGSIVINELNPGVPVLGFTASFNLQISGGSAEPADGFSFNFGPDLPNSATTPLAAEQGAGTGFSFCVDNYRFLPAPIVGQPASAAGGGTATTSGMKMIYGGNYVAVVQIPAAWNTASYIPVSITVTPSGIATVIVNGTNAFGNITLPNYVATTGRFGMYSRTGGSFQGVSVDDLNIVTTTPITARGGTVSFDGNNVVYTAPTNQCGPDAFYYLVSDGQSGGSLVDQVNITVYPSNNTAPTIVACAANQTVAVGASCLAALPDLTSSLVVTDSCCCVVITQSPAAGTMAGLGTTTVTLTVSNVVGLIATCQAYVTNVDTTAPIITACQSDLTVECTGGGAHVLYTVTASDNCSTPLVNCTPLASGALFPLGMTTVTCTASDASGNVSAACVFNVTVADTTPPNITCVANKTVQCGTAWTFDKPTALDACGTNVIHIVDTVTNSACGNTFSATRTWNATDDSGNTSANCSQTVTVVDTTPPVIACSANLTNDCTSVAGAVVTFTTTATDTCDASPNVVCVPASGSTFALGVTTVNCTATDICGNHSGCSFTVTVKDAAGPPTLTIVRSGATAVISWPATCTTYTLQQASDLGTWSNSGAVVTLVSGHYQATVSDNTGYTFYRLKNP